MHPEVAVDLSPDPLIQAVRGYRGELLEMDAGGRVGAGQLHSGIDALVVRLKSLGLASGDRVVLAISNGAPFPALLCAVLECGASPILSHALTPAPELHRTAMRFGARHIVCDRPSLDDLSAVCASTTPITVEPWLAAHWSTVNAGDPAFNSRLPVTQSTPLHQTSGTTGVPKIAVRPGAAAVAEAQNYIQTTGINASDTIVVTSPMSHAYAYGMGFMVPMLSGANIVTMREFKAPLLFQAFAEARVTVFPAVPAMLEVVLFGAGDKLKDSPRTVFAAGAPLPERVARRYHEASGTIVRPLYGTTETGGITIAVDQRDGLCPGCVGPAMPSVQAEVRVTAPAGDGEPPLQTLWVRSPSMMAGYLGEEGIDRTPIADGWFNTGDLARTDEHGSIHLRGRITEVVNVGGMKVVPSEVEEVIAAMPTVREVKVYAGNSPSGAQFVKAAVVAEPGVNDKAIREYCASQLIYYKRPSAVLLLEELPKTPSGKVILNQLP